jgi:outer membrane protein assembly factor BamB
VELGEGYSSPVLAGGKVFIHHRRDPNEIVTAIDIATGKPVWEQSYSAKFTKQSAAEKMSKGPFSTPLVIGDKLITVGGTAVIVAWDTATGKQLWKKDLAATVDTAKLFCGTSASPLVVDGNVVVQVGSDVHGGRVIAFDPATGNEKWTWKGPGPGYSSPILIKTAGSSQVVTMTQESIVGIDAKSGVELWSIPFPDEWQENIVTPLWTGKHLIVSGVRQGMHAYALLQSGGKWIATENWKNPGVTMYMSSPVLADGTIYGHSQKKRGHFVALDAATGAVKWASEGRDGDNAFVLLTAGNVVYLTNGGEMVVVKRSPDKLDVVKRYKLTEMETWAMPAFVGGSVYLRDAGGLMRLAAAK